MAGILTSLAAADDALAADEFTSKRGNAKSDIGGFNAECGLQVFSHRHPGKQPCGESCSFTLASDAARCPSEGIFWKIGMSGQLGGCAFLQVPRRWKGVIAALRYPLSWSDRCLAQPSAAQLLKRNLRDSSVLENNRLQARAECRFDGGYEARLDLDLVRQGAVYGGFKEVRVVEATKNGLRAFVEPFALLLQLAKNLHPGFDACSFLGHGIQRAFGRLALLLRGLVGYLGIRLLRLRTLRGEPCKVGAASDLLYARSEFSRGIRSRFGLSLQKPQSGFGHFPPSSGRGNLAAQRAQSRVKPCDRGADFLDMALGCSALLAGDAHFLSVFVEGRLVRVQRPSYV